VAVDTPMVYPAGLCSGKRRASATLGTALTAPTAPSQTRERALARRGASIEEWVAQDWREALANRRVRPHNLPVASPSSPRQDLAGAITLLAVVLLLTVSDHLLTWVGNHYTTPGGNVLERLHPATYLLYLAFLVLAVPVNPARYIAAMAASHPAMVVHAAAMAMIMAYCTWRFGISGAAFINESLMMPAVTAMVLYGLPHSWRRRIFLVAVALLLLDAAIGLVEYAAKARLIPYFISGKPHEEPIFRSTALLGHPLKNAAVLATFLCALAVIQRPRALVFLSAGLITLSLLAFGSRTAFVLCAAAGGLAALVLTFRALRIENFSYGKLLGILMLVLAAPMAGGALYAIFGAESRIAQTLFWDTSAESRLFAFRAFERVSPAEIAFGIGPEGIDRVLTYLKQFTTLTDIENAWILLLLNFGLICFLMFVVSFGWMMLAMLKGAPLPVVAAVVVFMVMASSNNSLAVKDSSLVLLVVAVTGAVSYARLNRREEARGYSPRAVSAAGSNSRLGLAGSRGTVMPSGRFTTSPRPVAMPNRSA
jgi:hypothetical protein